jgi:hypothetical protein
LCLSAIFHESRGEQCEREHSERRTCYESSSQESFSHLELAPRNVLVQPGNKALLT